MSKAYQNALSNVDFYPIATGQYLTDCLTEENFNRLALDEVDELKAEAYEDLPAKEVANMIHGLVNEFKQTYQRGYEACLNATT